MQTEEQEKLSIKEKSKLFVQLLEARKKHFVAIRAKEKRNKPPTKAQQRNTIEVRAEAEIAQESSSKRAGNELEQESIKKQKVDEDKETTELQRLIEVAHDKKEVAIDVIPLATKPPSIFDYKIHKERKKTYYQIIRADRSSKMYLVFSHMLKSFDREDLETLWKLVKAKHGATRPEEGYEIVLWGDLKTMFDPHVEDQIWHHYQLLIRGTHGLDIKYRSILRGLGTVKSRGSRLYGADRLTRRRMTWRQFILALGLHTELEMAEAGFGAYWAGSDRLIPEKGGRLCHRMIAYSISGRGQAPKKVTGIDLFYLRNMDRGTANVPQLLAQYLFRHAEGRKSGVRLSGGHFIGRLAMHFGLVSDEGLRGLQVVTRELPLIDLHELGRLHICMRYGDTWAWVAQGSERQQAVAAGASEADEAGQAAKEVAREIPGPAQAPPPAPQPRTMSQSIKRLEEEVHDLRRIVVGLRGDVASFTTEQSRVSTWLISCMTQLMDVNGQTYQPFDSLDFPSVGVSGRRRVRIVLLEACQAQDGRC
ncbi:hypothetical protein Tco_0893170 [Tanacetum coccineum]|uniref:Uncharacterized protein n=1 Tax=Tanacetum coccineum TaxID=301880 RepID=A0ABQ5CB52_9ASTR